MQQKFIIEKPTAEKSISESAFRRKSILRRIFMLLPELEAYYCARRKHRFEQGKKLKYIRLRETFYPVFPSF